MLFVGCGIGAPAGLPPQIRLDGDAAVVVAAGDIACPAERPVTDRTCQHRATADLIAGLRPDAVLALGDLQYEKGELADFQSSYGPTWGRFAEITYPAPGNHEYRTAGAAGYFDYFGLRAGKPDAGWYSVDIAGWHVVVLNSECEQIGGCGRDSDQRRWLIEDLAANPTRCSLAVWHQARFSSGEKHGDNREYSQLWQDLQDANAELVLNGHDHTYERFGPQRADGTADPKRGVVAFVVGTGGKELRGFGPPRSNSIVRSDATFGVLELTLRSEGYSWRFVGLPGSTFSDEGSAACH